MNNERCGVNGRDVTMGSHYEGWKVIGYWGMCRGRVDGVNGGHEGKCSWWRTGLKTGAGDT